MQSAVEGTGLGRHHLIPQRLRNQLEQATLDKLAIVLTPSEHENFTNAWRDTIKYGDGTLDATRESILKSARQVYKDYPDILDALRKLYPDFPKK